MSVPTRPETTTGHALWLGALLVNVAGLFGMHGLDSHGVAAPSTIAHAVMTTPGAVAVADGHDRTSEAVNEASAAVTMSPRYVVTGHRGMADGVAGGCMAVLVVALIALARRLGNALGRPLCRLLAQRARAPDTHVRDPDPPAPIILSIRRC